MRPDPTRDALVSLCERALARDLARPELDAAWPEPVGDPALVPLREALADGIDHTLTDAQAWRQMPEYGDIESYVARLRRQP